MCGAVFKALLFLLLFVIWFVNPKPSYAYYCTFQFFYRPTLVVATAKDQTINCEDYKTKTIFSKNFTIKGSSPDQFEIKTVNPSTRDTCKNYPSQSQFVLAGAPQDQFEVGKKYILAIFPDNNSTSVSMAVCERMVNQVNGLFDPKVILATVIIYTQPIWITGVFVTLYLSTSIFGKFLPDILALIFSGLIVLILYGLIFYLLIRIVKYIMKKVKNAQKPNN